MAVTEMSTTVCSFFREDRKAFKAILWQEKLKAFSFVIFSIHVVPAGPGCSPSASRKGTILDEGRPRGSKGWMWCQRTQPVFGTLPYSTRWPAGAAIWPVRDISFRIIGPGSMPGSALWAGMTEVEYVCSDSPDCLMSPLRSHSFQYPPWCLFRFSKNMTNDQAGKDWGWAAATLPRRE